MRYKGTAATQAGEEGVLGQGGHLRAEGSRHIPLGRELQDLAWTSVFLLQSPSGREMVGRHSYPLHPTQGLCQLEHPVYSPSVQSYTNS